MTAVKYIHDLRIMASLHSEEKKNEEKKSITKGLNLTITKNGSIF